jgi:uncharacterized protein YfbU (UPF0304 family)
MPEQYAYINFLFEGSTEEALAEYRRLTKLATGGVGMDTKEHNKIVDELMEKNSISGDPGMIETMNIEQQGIIQAIKKSRARLKARGVEIN